KLMDDPANFPVSEHCIGGRHRTGTFVALYRMEYDRWSAEQPLNEMNSIDFGPPAPIQDNFLRTYLRRPLPTAAEWTALQAVFAELLDRPQDYATMILRLRQGRRRPAIEQAAEEYVRNRRPFALCLAHRLIDQPSDRLSVLASRQAS